MYKILIYNTSIAVVNYCMNRIGRVCKRKFEFYFLYKRNFEFSYLLKKFRSFSLLKKF